MGANSVSAKPPAIVWSSSSCSLVIFNRAKIPTARPNEPGMTPKILDEVGLDIYRTVIRP